MGAGGIVLVALAIAVGLVGIIVPLLPGALLVLAAIAVWAVLEHTVVSWVTLGIVTVLIGGVVAGILIARQQSTDVAQPPPPAPAVPVVLVGADCEVLGAAGVSATGQKAYCARLPPANTVLWSLVSGVVPSPTVTPGPDEQVFPAGIEEQVRVCVQQTKQSRTECRDDIRRGNLYGPA